MMVYNVFIMLDVEILKKTILFNNFTSSELLTALKNLNYKIKKIPKNTYVYTEGHIINKLGIVLNGSVNIEHVDILGNKTIITRIDKADFFAEAFALVDKVPLNINVLTNEASEIMFLNIKNLYRNNINGKWKQKLILNLLNISIAKNIKLAKKNLYISSKSIRSRVITYLKDVSVLNKSSIFDIPYNRQQLADFLCVDRSALSYELSKMKKEHIIDYHKNTFKILIY